MRTYFITNAKIIANINQSSIFRLLFLNSKQFTRPSHLDVWSQLLILCKLDADLQLTAFVAGIINKIFSHVMTLEKYTKLDFADDITKSYSFLFIKKYIFKDSIWDSKLIALIHSRTMFPII